MTLQDLRTLALSATPGPYDVHKGYMVRAIRDSLAIPLAEFKAPYLDFHNGKRFKPNHVALAERAVHANVHYFAAVSPNVVLALLDVVEAAVAMRKAALSTNGHDGLFADCDLCGYVKRFDEALSRLPGGEP